MIDYGAHTAGNTSLNLQQAFGGTDQPFPFLDETLSLVYLGKDTLLDATHALRRFLLVEVRSSRNGVLATTYFLESEEYGWGISQDAALSDLGSSLVGYLGSLQSRVSRLSDSGRADLAALLDLFGAE